MSPQVQPDQPGVYLYWLPLGAGGHSVKWNGRIFEAVDAAAHGRRRCALFHSALEIRSSTGRHVIEQGPAGPTPGAERGVVAVGPVGLRPAGRLRWFRYEIRCWADGVIDDVAEATQGAQVLSLETAVAERLLGCVSSVPALTWGRDESRAGEMWNSNSVVSWLLTKGGVDASRVNPPPGGRAPGWTAGIVVAHRR